MKLSFSQLEAARKNPAKFAQRYALKKRGFSSKNFRTYFSAAMRRFHDGSSKQQVVKFFRERSTEKLSTLLYFPTRLNYYATVLEGYCDSFAQQGCQFVEAQKKLLLQVGGHTLTGKVERFDLRVPTGYRATVTQMEETDWQDELRWPLIQKAIAGDFSCDPSEVQVGVFCFESGEYDYRIFSAAEIADAEVEAMDVLSEVEGSVPLG